MAPVPHGREKIHEELKGHMVYFCCSIRVYTGSQLCSTWRFRTGPASRVLQAPDIGAAPKFPQSPEVPGRSLHGSRVCGAAPLALRTSAPPSEHSWAFFDGPFVGRPSYVLSSANSTKGVPLLH